MKKLLMGLFIFVFLAIGSQAHASLLSDALLKIQNLKNEIIQLKSSLKASVLDASIGVTPTTDLTPRISYWSGKVNQHVDIDSSTWQTDGDGSSGAEIDKLTYCKKWYPNTTSVVDYKNETINSWHDAGNMNDYMNIRLSYKCVEALVLVTSIPVVTSPSSSSITQTSAVLWANISSLGYPTSVSAYGHIYYGTSPRPSGSVVDTNITATVGSYSIPVSGLTCGTRYYFYGALSGPSGVGYSPDGIFTTLSCVTAVTPIATCIDSDGGDYPFVSGKATMSVYSSQTTPVMADTCYNSITNVHSSSCTGAGCQVMENICVDIDGDGAKDTYNSHYDTCPNGCSNGACYTPIKEVDTGCSTGVVYSSITGAKCPAFAAKITPTTDLTPRISYWQGKVNQHVSVSEGMWQTDADGVSGAEIDKLTYCKKWYPNTTSVVEYKNETINAWHDRGNVNDYPNTRMSYRCAETTIDLGCSNGTIFSSTTGQLCQNNSDAYVNLVYPKSGETFKAGQDVEIKIDSNLTRVGAFEALIYKKNDNSYALIKKFDTANNGIQTLQIPYGTPEGEYKIDYGHTFGTGDFTKYGTTTFYVTSATIIDNGCLNGAIYSSVTRKKCFEKDEVKDTGCIDGQNYSSMTGKPCALGLYKKDNTDVLNPITSSITRTLKRGIKGDDVKILQLFLNLAADGSFGPQTQAKVMEWQAAHGLTADGSFGRMSREKAGITQ